MNKNEVFEGNKPGVFAQSEVKSLFAILNFHAHLNFFQNSIDNEFKLLASAYDKNKSPSSKVPVCGVLLWCP